MRIQEVAREAAEVVKAAIAKIDSSFTEVTEAEKKNVKEAHDRFQKQIESVIKLVGTVNEICSENDTAASAEKTANLKIVDKDVAMEPVATPPPNDRNDGDNNESELDSPKCSTPVKPTTRSNRLAAGKKISKVRTVRGKKATANDS